MEDIQQKSWFSRNWGWVLGGGCLTIIVIFAIGFFAIFYGFTKVIKSSEPYKYALAEASENQEVILLLGEPIEADGIMNGNISTSNSSGEVDISIPISGSKSKGNIVVVGNKVDGEWHYEELYVLIKGSQTKINLLDKSLEGI
ncbi:MAG: cytochrome c oxidase assembly factor Coa1 family protein [Jejuia sp.]